jgi:hypothetical protein
LEKEKENSQKNNLSPFPQQVSYIGPSVPKDLAALSSASAESAAVFERVGPAGDAVDVAWQRPPAGARNAGTMFLAHGCNHAATDFFPRSERCKHCMGLPEVGAEKVELS